LGLNIAFYTDTYLPAVDGVVTSILNFRSELERRGHKVYLFGSRNITRGSSHPESRVFLYPGLEFRPYPQYSLALFPYNSMNKLKSLEIDLLHAHTPFIMGFAALVSSKVQKYPLVGSYHTLINNREVIKAYYPKNKQLKRFTSRYLLKYVKFFYRKCNATTAPSHAIMGMLQRYGIENVSVVPNSVDLKVFNGRVSGEAMRESLGMRDGEKMVLYLGRLSREKRIDVMLRAASKITRKRKDIRFVIGGAGPSEAYYKGMARRLGLQKNVIFTGSVSRRQLPKLYAAADALCLPSTFETQGIVSLEAMASGKPVVGANYLALKELIKSGKNGEKFRPGDYMACAEKIEKVLNNTDAYINNALETAKEFSKEKVTDKLLDVYNLVLAA
jgi:1,2-diacylglycerol 3-alpha-glucosyltransferase